MLGERPRIEHRAEEAGRHLGYDATPTRPEHAARTFTLRYRGDWGPDHVKVDCVFLNRSPLVAPGPRPCAVRPDAEASTFCDAELAGGKVKVFFNRVKVRDLYDVCNLEVEPGSATVKSPGGLLGSPWPGSGDPGPRAARSPRLLTAHRAMDPGVRRRGIDRMRRSLEEAGMPSPLISWGPDRFTVCLGVRVNHGPLRGSAHRRSRPWRSAGCPGAARRSPPT